MKFIKRVWSITCSSLDVIAPALLITMLLFPIFSRETVLADAPGWWNSSWSYYKQITLDSIDQVPSTLTNFPVLINITDTDLRDNALPNGSDIAFVLASDNAIQFKHEIEKYVGATGELVAWVNCTSLPHDSDLVINMYYGNAGASNQTDAENVWDSNYMAVWHMNSLLDSTSNNIDLTNDGADSGAIGKIGDAYDFVLANTDYMYHATFLDSAWSAATWEGWTSRGDTNVSNYWISKTSISGQDRANIYNGNDANNHLLGGTWEGSNTGATNPASVLPFAIDGQFYYQAVTYEANTKLESWVDGVGGSSYQSAGNVGTMRTGTFHNFMLGSYGASTYWNGIIDEVRISSIRRSDAWMTTTYNTGNNASVDCANPFLSIGSEQTEVTNTAPTQSGESPINTSIDIAVTPSLYVICLDDDADNMNATWHSNSSGAWVQFASNGTIANNTNITQINSNFSAYSTTYYWSVNLTDDNGGWNNETYHFTTKVITWQDINTDINGEFTNTQTWQDISTTINGEFTNTLTWQVILDSINGEFTNALSWQDIDIDMNGEFTNSLTWKDISTNINGEFTNSLTWKDISTNINGEFSSQAISWQDISTNINGEFTNTSSRTWQDINTDINGEFTNSLTWKDISTNINGEFTSQAISWQDISTNINGEFINTTISTWKDINTDMNGEFTNSLTWQVINNTINGTFNSASLSWQDINTEINGTFNSSGLAWQDISTTINGTFTNTSSIIWQDINTDINGTFNSAGLAWQDIDTSINGSFTNTQTWQVIDDTINGKFTNISSFPTAFSNETPSNNSIDVCPCCDAMCINVGELNSNVNMTIWRHGEHEASFYMVENYINIANGTYCFCIDGHIDGSMYRSVRYNTTYYWYIYAEDYYDNSLNTTSSTYQFTTATNSTDCSTGASGNPYVVRYDDFGIIGLIGLLGILSLFLLKKKRRKNK